MEDPGYPPTRALLANVGLAAVPVPVDAEGLQVAHGLRTAPRARAAVVTPAHQSPLGVSLSLARRLELLDWASRQRTWIIEDDYDGEYRYASRPLPALQSLDRDGRVLFAGTFSKVLFPAVRLAYLVVPPALVGRFAMAAEVAAAGSPQLMQAIVAAFVAEGHFARHVQRMRRLYAERRANTIAGLEDVLAPLVRVDEQPGGMHLILRLKGMRSDRRMVARMREAGLYGEALSDWTSQRGSPGALLIGFTNIESRDAAQRLAGRLRALL